MPTLLRLVVMLSLLTLLVSGRALARSPERVSALLVLDEVADGLRQYYRQTDMDKCIPLLERLARTREARVAVAMGEFYEKERSAKLPPGVNSCLYIAAQGLLRRYYVPTGQPANECWENNKADLRRRAGIMDPAGERSAQVARIRSLFGLGLGLVVAAAAVGAFWLDFTSWGIAIGSALFLLSFAAARVRAKVPDGRRQGASPADATGAGTQSLSPRRPGAPTAQPRIVQQAAGRHGRRTANASPRVRGARCHGPSRAPRWPRHPL